MEERQEDREEVQRRSKMCRIGIGDKGRGTVGKGRETGGNVRGTAEKGEGQESRMYQIRRPLGLVFVIYFWWLGELLLLYI